MTASAPVSPLLVRYRPRRSLLQTLFMIGCILLACLLWRTALAAHGELEQYGSATLFLQEDLPTAPSYSEMQKTENRAERPVSFALWSQTDNQLIRAGVFNRTASVSLLLVRGDSRTVLPVAQRLHQEDYTGCLLDRDTAIDLFGSANAEGQTIRYDDKLYTIRGVFPAPSATMVLQARPDDGTPLSNISLEDGEQAEAFSLRHGLTPSRTLRTEVFAQAALPLSRLPVLTALVLLLELLLRLLQDNRLYPVRRTLLTGCVLALVTVGFLWLLTLLPPSMTPSRWSDFGHWSNTFTGLRKGLLTYFSAPKYRPEFLCLSSLLHSAAGLLSAMLLLPARKLWYHS